MPLLEELATAAAQNRNMNGMKSELARIFEQGGNAVHLSATFCLLWVAVVDGVVDDDEQRLILKVGGAGESSPSIPKLLQLVRRRDTASLIAACDVLRQALTHEARLAFLTIMIELVAVDGRLSLSENHFCRFFADLFGVSPEGLRLLYRTTIGAELPGPGDPSSISWWESRTRRQRGSRQSGHSERQEGPSDRQDTGGSRSRTGPMSAAEAYVVLGLRPGSVAEEITKAYRRAVQAHHPDRFAELGPEAQRAAHEMFLRIKRAYEVLT